MSLLGSDLLIEVVEFNNGEVTTKIVPFRTYTSYAMWVENQRTLPGVRRVEKLERRCEIYMLDKVWVATVSDENDSPGPAVYVAPYMSATADNLLAIIRKQQGVPDGEDLLDWMDLRGKTAVWDTYYVETGEE